MKNVLITGASRGIGAECAGMFARKGYHVIINYNSSQTAADDLCRKLTGNGLSAETIKADVSILFSI